MTETTVQATHQSQLLSRNDEWSPRVWAHTGPQMRVLYDKRLKISQHHRMPLIDAAKFRRLDDGDAVLGFWHVSGKTRQMIAFDRGDFDEFLFVDVVDYAHAVTTSNTWDVFYVSYSDQKEAVKDKVDKLFTLAAENLKGAEWFSGFWNLKHAASVPASAPKASTPNWTTKVQNMFGPKPVPQVRQVFGPITNVARAIPDVRHFRSLPAAAATHSISAACGSSIMSPAPVPAADALPTLPNNIDPALANVLQEYGRLCYSWGHAQGGAARLVTELGRIAELERDVIPASPPRGIKRSRREMLEETLDELESDYAQVQKRVCIFHVGAVTDQERAVKQAAEAKRQLCDFAEGLVTVQLPRAGR